MADALFNKEEVLSVMVEAGRKYPNLEKEGALHVDKSTRPNKLSLKGPANIPNTDKGHSISTGHLHFRPTCSA